VKTALTLREHTFIGATTAQSCATFAVMEPLPTDEFIAPPVHASAHPSLLPREQPYLRIERTFIFADVTRFTAYTEAHGADRAAGLLTVFRHLTRTIASQRGVRVAKWLGDGAMLVGVDAPASIAFGAHLIAAFGHPLTSIRVGIATGEALLFEGDDYIGGPVNLAARLCAAADPGRILAACSPLDVPHWVHHEDHEPINLRGLGTVHNVLRLTAGDE